MASASLRRARPLLGTFVEITVDGLDDARASAAIACAFAAVADVHRAMSFHEPASDVARLNRAGAGRCVRVAKVTYEVLALSRRIAAVSAGRFDPTIAAQQVARGLLPRSDAHGGADPAATWRDIELLDGNRVRLARRLSIDLGGIAKGYAVDRAIDVLVAAGAKQACVNAGGDLRVAGPRAERVHLRSAAGILSGASVEIMDAALATSVAAADPLAGARALRHFDGVSRRAVARNGRLVSVAAPQCVIAVALTKVVLVAPDELARSCLLHFDAQAIEHTPAGFARLGAVA